MVNRSPYRIVLDIDDAAWKVRSRRWEGEGEGEEEGEEEEERGAPDFSTVASSTRLATSRAAAAPRMTLPTISQGAMSCCCFKQKKKVF